MKGLAALCSQCLLFILPNNYSLGPAALSTIFAVSFVVNLQFGYTSPDRHHVADALAVFNGRLRHRAVWKHDCSGTVITPSRFILVF